MIGGPEPEPAPESVALATDSAPSSVVAAAAETAVDGWVAAWNEDGSEARHQWLAGAVADGCEFQGPTGTVTGRQALHAAIAEAREFLPGATVVRDGPVWTQEGGLRFAWEVRSADGARVLAGVDTVELDATGRLNQVVVLAAPSPSSA